MDEGHDYPFDLLLVDTAHAKEAPFDVTIPTNGKVAADQVLRTVQDSTRMPDESLHTRRSM